MRELRAECHTCRYARPLVATDNHRPVTSNVRPMKRRCGCVLKDLVVYRSQEPCDAFVWAPHFMRLAEIAGEASDGKS